MTWFLRYGLRHAGAVICNSRYTAGEVARLSAREVSILPFGSTVNPQAAPKDPDKPVKEILFAGRLVARKGLGVLLIAVAAVLAFALYVLLPSFWSPQSRVFAGPLGYPAVMRVLGRPIGVQAEPAQTRTMVRTIAAEGMTAYLNEIPVHSEVPGIVTQILAEAGQSVQRGKPLLYINPGGHTTRMFDLRRQLSQSEQRQANVALEREQRLYKSNFTSQARLDSATANRQRAEIASRLSLEEYAHSLRSRSATVTGEPLPWAGTRVSGHRVVIAATIEGTVIERNVQLGENLINLKEPLMVLGDQLIFRAEIDQRYAGLLREGAEGRFYLRARPGQPVPARVLRVSHTVRSAEQRRAGDPPPFTFSVWMSIPSERLRAGDLMPGMNGYAIFEQRYTAHALPERALTRYSGRTGTVLVVDDSNNLRVEPVTYTGAQDGWIAIESGGVREGDFVVVSGQTALKAGDKVVLDSTLPGNRELADAQNAGAENLTPPAIRVNLP